MKKFVANLTGSIGVGLLVAEQALAQSVKQPSQYGLPDLSNGGGVGNLLTTIVLFMLGVAGTIAVIFIIIGGFQYIFSGANEDLASKGKSTVTNAVIGLAIILLSYTVITVVIKTIQTAP